MSEVIIKDTLVADAEIISQTQTWLKSVIVKNNFCPFAQRELIRDSIHYAVIRQTSAERCLEAVIDECRHLDECPEIETTLLIYPEACSDFEEFLMLNEIADALLVDQGYEGIYQLASFHPDYCFQGAPPEDPANYTNRSLYPMLHLLREASVTRAVDNYSQPENIPERNIAFCRKQGSKKLQVELEACRRPCQQDDV